MNAGSTAVLEPGRAAALQAPRIRVLFVIGQLGLGGAEKNLTELVQRMDPARFEPAVLVFNPGGEWEVDLQAAGIPLYFIKPRFGRFVDRLGLIWRLYRDFRPDVVHGFDMITACYCAIARIVVPVPVVISSFLATFLTPRLRHAHRWLARWVDWTVCNAERGRDYLEAECGIRRERTVLIPNGLDFDRLERRRPFVPSLRSELGLGPEDILIGLVGKLNADKDPLVFAKAAAIVLREFPNAMFCVIGQGGDRPMVEEYLRTAGLERQFRLLGLRPDAACLARDFTIGVLSSRTEGLPTALTEYMYWSKPCVATDVGDCARVVLHGETGFIVPPGNPEAFAQALLELLRNPARAAEMGRAGRQRVEQCYPIGRYVDEHERLYQEALAPRNAATGRGLR